MLFIDRGNFTSSFLNWIPFLFFYFCLISLAKISSIMLNRGGKSGHPGLVPDLGRKALNLLPLSIMLSVKYGLITLRYIPSLPYLLRVFIMKGC